MSTFVKANKAKLIISLSCFSAIIIFASFAFIKNARSQANTWPDYRGNMMGVQMPASGAIPNGTLYCEPPVSDTLPMVCYYQGADAYEKATGARQTGGNISECAGIGTRQVTIDNFMNCNVDTVTVTINGTANVLTEGIQWSAMFANNEQTCNSLASAITTLFTGTTARASCDGTATVYIHPDPILHCSITLAESDATCTTLLQGIDGQIVTSDGSAAYPRIRSISGNHGLYAISGSTLGISTNGGEAFRCNQSYLQLPAGRYFQWLGRSVIESTADGKMTLRNTASTTGFLMDGTSDAIVRFRNRADTLDASAYAANFIASAGMQNDGAAVTTGTMTRTATGQVLVVAHKLSWTNAMITALGANPTGDILVATLPAGYVVKDMYAVISTPETALPTFLISVGRTGVAYDDYLIDGNGQAAANTIYGDAAGERGINLIGYDLVSVTATTGIYMHCDAGAGTLNNALNSTGYVIIETTKLP